MPLYYFDRCSDGKVLVDVTSTEIADLNEARTRALHIVHRHLRRRSRGRDWSRWAVDVSDEDGRTVLLVPLATPERQKSGPLGCCAEVLTEVHRQGIRVVTGFTRSDLAGS